MDKFKIWQFVLNSECICYTCDRRKKDVAFYPGAKDVASQTVRVSTPCLQSLPIWKQSICVACRTAEFQFKVAFVEN